MTIPSFAQAEIYKAKTIISEVRAAIELDHPVFSGAFSDDFAGATLDTDKWFQFVPSWGAVTVGGGTVTLSVTDPAGGIAPPWIQSRHNLAFPVSRDTDWTFNLRCQFPAVTGFGVFIRICGRSFRDAEAIWALKCNTADGLTVHCPDGFSVDSVIWSTPGGAPYRRYRVFYDASAQTYTCSIDQDDDGVYETVVVVPVAGRYADCIVIGNSTAIQGHLGAWTSVQVDSVSVTGTAETVQDPQWAAPFTYDGTRFSYLPGHTGGRVSIDVDNIVDAAELTLANRGLNEDLSEDWQLYTNTRFWNRRCIIEARAGDGAGNWAPWEILIDGLCAEKQVRINDGICTLTVPMRDRWRARADDMEILGCYSDAPDAIPGVGMNMTVAQIIEDIYQAKCGLAAAAMSILATPNNTPRTYNIFRQSAQQAVKTMCDQAALCLYARRSDAQIQVAEWYWGTGAPRYTLSTAEELQTVEWTESAFDVTSGEELSFENTNLGGIAFQCQWPPHREPFYGRVNHGNAVVCQAAADHDARPINALAWWARNRKLGSVVVTMPAQFWLDINDEVWISDDRFLGLRDNYICDGIDISWGGESNQPAQVTARFIDPHPDVFLRKNLMP